MPGEERGGGRGLQAGDAPEGEAAVQPDAGITIGFRQMLKGRARQASEADGVEIPIGPGRDNLFRPAGLETHDHAQAEPKIATLQRAIPGGVVNIHRVNDHAMRFCIRDDLRRGVEAHRLRI